MRELFGAREGEIHLWIQRAVISHSLNIYPHTERDVLRIAEECTETVLVILVNFFVYCTKLHSC